MKKLIFPFILLIAISAELQTVAGRRCGNRQISRVIGGYNAARWPWQAELLKKSKDGSFRHLCGASLINDQWVVTATHCLFANPSPQMYKVKLGEYDRYLPEPSEQVFDVTAVRLHQDFLTNKEYGYDIAVVKLSRKVNMTGSVRPICLPPPHQRIAVGTMCYLTGWGRTSYASGSARILQEVQLPIVSFADCLRGNGHLHFVDNYTMVCAGFGGNSIVSGCNGDSGGPLVCNEGGRWTLRGVVSWGDHKCAAGTTYSVFARVSSFVHWIMNKMMSPTPVFYACQDSHWYCAQWVKKNVCFSYYYKNILKKYCPVSCGYCNSSVITR
ncbi:elastase-1-like [Actinia tenebrosa]|uniref:Elastase-1-like n=1 Tax=Actinia tenebrosa TaxID=6105 RepID=A0A6P8J539_ACTTE|nr:elastase-1-like [Actinia tenebrosa]